MPGVRTPALDLGGQSVGQAVAALEQEWQARTITLDAGGKTWAVTLPMLGIVLDAEATARLAHARGRSLAALREMLSTGNPIVVMPVWQVDAAVARATLQGLAPQLGVPPVDAGMRVVGAQVEVTPPVPGRALDVAATAAWLERNAAQVVQSGRLPLVMVPVLPGITNVNAALAEANRLLSRSLSIRAYDPITDQAHVWTIQPEVWGKWLSVALDPADATRIAWTVDAESARAYLASQSAALGLDRYVDLDRATAATLAAIAGQAAGEPLRIYHQPRRHTVQAGQTLASIARDYGIPYPWIQQANPGLGDSLWAGQVVAIPSPDVLLPLPVVEGKRIVVSLSQQRMWVYEGGGLKWEWPVSTGIESSPTAPGVFQVQTHEENAYASNWKLWMPYFMGIYRPVPTSDFMNGFHGFPTRGGATLLWTGNLGRPVTYGCILISTDNAIALYSWAENGVVVEIRR
jgi:LysM repeat protein